MMNICQRVVYLVGAVDLGSVLQQEMDDLCVASTRRPDNGVDAVLLGQRRGVKSC